MRIEFELMKSSVSIIEKKNSNGQMGDAGGFLSDCMLADRLTLAYQISRAIHVTRVSRAR